MSQEKIETSIKGLEPNILSQISIHVGDEASQSNLALTSRMFGCGEVQDKRTLTKLSQYIAAGQLDMAVKLVKLRPDLSDIIKFLLKPVLYKTVGFGEQNNVEIILKLYPEFFFTYARIKDISGVQPIINIEGCMGITLFQHAIWAGDIRHMCKMMLKCLPKNEYGETIKTELLRQYYELKENGVVYEVDGKVRHEKQFNLQVLIGALKIFVNDFHKWTDNEKNVQWCTNIGSLQNLLPAIIRHHYCNTKEPFCNKPNFLSANLIRSLEFYNIQEDKKQVWDNSLIGLGSKLAICAGDGYLYGLPAQSNRGEHPDRVKKDLAALIDLYEVITNIDLPALLQCLEGSILCIEAPLESSNQEKPPECVIS